MDSINKGEYGNTLYVNMGTDLTTASKLTISLEPKIGLSKVITNGVTVGLVDIIIHADTYLANEYLQYTTKDGDLDQSGQWRKRGTVQLTASSNLISDYEQFTVLE